MTDAEILTTVKNGLGITGTFQDDTLNVYIAEVKAFMLSAGVEEPVTASSASVGCIMRGVADLWNYGSGNAKLSDYFKLRVLQLKKVIRLFITQAQGTTITVERNEIGITNEATLHIGEELTISVTGGTIKVNGADFTSGNTYTVSGCVSVVSTAGGDEDGI